MTTPVVTTARPAAEALAEVSQLIQETWGYASLRPLQREAIEAVLASRDCVVVLPTGGGKSLCYQAPAIYLAQHGQGPMVVVSPLIALMKDQVDALRALGVQASQIDSSRGPQERRQTLDDLRAGRLHLLFVSPERLIGRPQGTPLATPPASTLIDPLRAAGVRRFAIDEAHCISHWGHDFRPEYRQLSTLKTLFPGCAIHAFTATATVQVRDDIAAQLTLENPALLVGNFDRPNLIYRVLPRRDMMGQIQDTLSRHPGEAGIIYCVRRRDVDDLVTALNAPAGSGRPRALGYHAGLTPQTRRQVQEAFAREQCDLIVATVAFGMGIDRSNIRLVLHTGLPKSIEAYQQETGRAGRDGLEAECVLLYSGQDVRTWQYLLDRSVQDAVATGTPVSADYILSARRHLEEMDRLARGAVCRHQALVEYFGQPYQPARTSCRACDHCLGDTEVLPDALRVAQKILSAVARTGQRFGAGHVIAVLRGEHPERVRQLRHDQLSVHGLLADRSSRELRDFIYQLIGQGVLAQENLLLREGRPAPILKLTPASVEVMKGLRPVRLIQTALQSAGESRRTASSWEAVDRPLFEELRRRRKAAADRRGVPPYMIFSDATLRELARVRPTTLAGLRYIYGIGQTKLQECGGEWVAVIKTHCAAHHLPSDLPLAPAAARGSAGLAATAYRRPQAQKALAWKLFAQNTPIGQVARQTGRKPSTIADYLAEYISQERPASIAAWIPDSIYARVAAAIKTTGSTQLKPLFIALNETVPYDQIRLVAAHRGALARDD